MLAGGLGLSDRVMYIPEIVGAGLPSWECSLPPSDLAKREPCRCEWQQELLIGHTCIRDFSRSCLLHRSESLHTCRLVV